MCMMPDLLVTEGLSKRFATRKNLLGRARGWHHAVADVSFTVATGQTFAIVGESGAGKSTIARLILRLIEPDAGTLYFQGADIRSLAGRDLRTWRRHAQMIFQDPYTSLDPRKMIRSSLAEPLIVHEDLSRSDREARIVELVQRVGLDDSILERYPYEFSGGQLQRIAIARALATYPSLVVCDEPVAALDMSIRAQVINLLLDLQGERHMGYVFISHDLSLVGAIADRVGVMYKGRFVETGTTMEIFDSPRHPYTKELMRAVPVADPLIQRERLQEAPPEVRMVPSTEGLCGCDFAPRCPVALGICKEVRPELKSVHNGSKVACHLY